jgi:hypothetical protein
MWKLEKAQQGHLRAIECQFTSQLDSHVTTIPEILASQDSENFEISLIIGFSSTLLFLDSDQNLLFYQTRFNQLQCETSLDEVVEDVREGSD